MSDLHRHELDAWRRDEDEFPASKFPIQQASSLVDKRRPRRADGSHSVEFIFCFVFLFFAILVPLYNYSALMIRWTTASQVAKNWANTLAKERKLSTAFKLAQSETSVFRSLIETTTGVKIVSVSPSIIVRKVDDPANLVDVKSAGEIPSGWLPDKGTHEYLLQIAVEGRADPLIASSFFGLKIPGLTEPTTLNMAGSSIWENQSRDPLTTEYYINE